MRKTAQKPYNSTHHAGPEAAPLHESTTKSPKQPKPTPNTSTQHGGGEHLEPPLWNPRWPRDRAHSQVDDQVTQATKADTKHLDATRRRPKSGAVAPTSTPTPGSRTA